MSYLIISFLVYAIIITRIAYVNYKRVDRLVQEAQFLRVGKKDLANALREKGIEAVQAMKEIKRLERLQKKL